MTARAMWKGRVAIGQRCVPVKLYAAQRDRRIHPNRPRPAASTPGRRSMPRAQLIAALQRSS